MFSGERIDPGTRILLVETTPADTDREPSIGADAPRGDLVDLGAGYGPIALTLALRHPQRTVWAVEPNERARRLCTANAVAAGVGDRVRVVAPEEVPTDLAVAGLHSNPPIRIGKQELHRLLERWMGTLTEGAEAWLVVHRHLGADSLARWLADAGHEVRRVASRRGYRVLKVRPNPRHA